MSGQRINLTSGKTNRRAFLGKGMALGGGAIGASILSGSRVFGAAAQSYGNGQAAAKPQTISQGDADILRFLAAAELIEADLWQQYNELGGVQDAEVPGGSGSGAYVKALSQLDSDMAQYVHDNTEDELSHAAFINAYLQAHGAEPVNLDRYRILPSSQATGAQKNLKRLTNLMQLTVDTTWWTRYRSRSKNPDLGDTFPPAIPGLSKGQFAAIPRHDDDLGPKDHLQAIANTAGFHFAFIEQGGSSLYPALVQRVNSAEVMRILLSIGPTETAHFQTWHDKAGNIVPLTDPTNGLVFPDLNSKPFAGEDFQTNLIMPEPTAFLDRKFPAVSIIRPTATKGAATSALKALTDDGLFIGQSQAFFDFMNGLAKAADQAQGMM